MYETEMAALELLHSIGKITKWIIRVNRRIKIVRHIIPEAGKGPLIPVGMCLVKISKAASIRDNTETLRFKLPRRARFHFDRQGPDGPQVTIPPSHAFLKYNGIFQHGPVFTWKAITEKKL